MGEDLTCGPITPGKALARLMERIGLLEHKYEAVGRTSRELIDEIVEYVDDLVNENSLLQRKFRAAVLANRTYGHHTPRCRYIAKSEELGNDCDCGWLTVKDAFPEVKA